VLGDDLADYRMLSVDARIELYDEAEVTLDFEMPGFEVQPKSRTFMWLNGLHVQEFHIRPESWMVGTNVRGRLSAYHGDALLAELSIAIRVAWPGP
jgi:hypothetical protein